MRPPLEFWFEFASTYSYPAAQRVEAQCTAAGVPLRWRPFLLGPIFAAQGWTDSPFNIYPVKGRNMWRDLERLCAGYGLALRRPSVFPRNGLLAARVACAGAAAPWLPAFVRSVYRANFADDRDIADAAVVGDILAALGQTPEPILAAAQSDDVKQRLRAQTDEAISRGVFGAPSFTVGDELFWGNDRLEAALACQRAGAADDATIDMVLDFWFGVPGAASGEVARRHENWFAAEPAFDALCRERFAGLVGRAARGELDAWQRTPRGRLALIIVLDQMPRNIFRGTAAAYLGDAKALPLALAGLDIGADRGLGVFERAFFYLPLEHAEIEAVQERSVALLSQLVAESSPAQRAEAEEWLNYARQHRDVVARFGRFPHRNAQLGRESTAAERAYLG
jgi:uncharacterized protein (DUF924 family)/2-hydroxychromene-2-carboxylate isomerase